MEKVGESAVNLSSRLNVTIGPFLLRQKVVLGMSLAAGGGDPTSHGTKMVQTRGLAVHRNYLSFQLPHQLSVRKARIRSQVTVPGSQSQKV